METELGNTILFFLMVDRKGVYDFGQGGYHSSLLAESYYRTIDC